MTAEHIRKRLLDLEDKDKAEILRRFFKTGPGEYGEGDRFLGIQVPQLRKLCKECCDMGLRELEGLLKSSFHEQRFLTLLILIRKYQKGGEAEKKRIFSFYLKSTRWINNWDLVDVSAPGIVGDFLSSRTREPLYKLARSTALWERRMAIVATLRFIKDHEFDDTFRIGEILLTDREDLIHKAVGWMLREVGKRDQAGEEGFLRTHYRRMPRTMLRYAIERFRAGQKQLFMKSGI